MRFADPLESSQERRDRFADSVTVRLRDGKPLTVSTAAASKILVLPEEARR